MVNRDLTAVEGRKFRRHVKCLRAPDGRFFATGARNKRRLKTWKAEDAAGLSGGAAIVVVQETAKSLAALDLAGGSAGFGARFDETVAQPLMRAFSMIMDQPLTA